MHILKQITVLTLALALTNCGSPAEEIDRTNVAPTAKLESAITVTRQEIQTATDAPSQTAADVGVVEPDVTISSAIVEKNEVRNGIVQRPSTSCQDLFLDAVEISAQNYLNNLEESWFSVRNNEKYSYVDPSGSVARNGPFATWFYEMAVEDVATTMPERFDSLEWADNMIMWQDYLDYTQATCDAYTGVGSIRSLQIALEKLLHQTGWSGHASHWEA
jgi:hypothetical protein